MVFCVCLSTLPFLSQNYLLEPIMLIPPWRCQFNHWNVSPKKEHKRPLDCKLLEVHGLAWSFLVLLDWARGTPRQHSVTTCCLSERKGCGSRSFFHLRLPSSKKKKKSRCWLRPRGVVWEDFEMGEGRVEARLGSLHSAQTGVSLVSPTSSFSTTHKAVHITLRNQRRGRSSKGITRDRYFKR